MTDEIYTAADLARICKADAKTVHNWAVRGHIDHFRTPGRHLRFRTSAIVDFLQRFGYPIPDQLTGKRNPHAE